jgi:putative toxin-antitoxin system antitoxin component (TIGR02293 family)
VAHNIGQMAHLHFEIENPIRLIGTVRQGFPTESLDVMAGHLKIDRLVLLRVLGISERTVQRKHQLAERLSPSASDRLARIDRIFDLAVEVFGGEDKAAEWLKRSSRPLGNEAPIELLDTDAGAQEVERELRQIEYSFAY